MVGKTLGHYQITSQLGKGGMGEVYRARDEKLGRDVAIKVVPQEFAKDADRVARFQREAKLLASLNHPNIASIYGLEESDKTNFLVLELVEGETLADQIKKGPIPVEEALKLALQIAEALEAAHEKGIIHRDLKPANIKVTPEGKVKVLDFGLAKAFAGDREEVNLSNSPTLSNAATQQGVILGTAAYMSPEQACGKTADKRADVWAFGVVLYEMLTGRSLFAGESVSQTLARVLERQPDFSALPPNLHPKILESLQRCLVKEAKDRCHDIADVRIDIKKVLADPSGVFVQPITAAEPRRKLGTILPWAAVTLILGMIIAGVAVWYLRTPEPRQVMRFDYELPENSALDIAVSPDGKQFAFTSGGGIYLRRIAEMDARLVQGTEAGEEPFFSPDGQWIGFFSNAEKKLMKIRSSGGAPIALCDVTRLVGASWNTDSTIVYSEFSKGIMRISTDGGTPKVIIESEKELLVTPQVLPNGKSVLFTLYSTPTKVYIQSLESGKRKELFAGNSARYLPTGHIVYGSGSDLVAASFDPVRLEITGGPVSVVNGIMHTPDGSFYAISDSGTLVYVPGSSVMATTAQRTLVWVNRDGKEEPLAIPPDSYGDPRLSPDGTKLALSIGNRFNSTIWIWDLIRKTKTRLTFEKTHAILPLWTLDGQRIVFSPHREQLHNSLYWKLADGTAKEELLVSVQDRNLFPVSWAGAGNMLLGETAPPGTSTFEIGGLSMGETREWKVLLHEQQYTQAQPQVSPDGKWLAYTSDESGQLQVYLRPFPEVDKGRWPVSTSGGDSPLWSPDGRQLFYRSGNAIMAVAVKTEPDLRLGAPKSLFTGTYAASALKDYPDPQNTWDISPDGKRFLMMKEPGTSAGGGPRKINIVLNWIEELKQRVPMK